MESHIAGIRDQRGSEKALTLVRCCLQNFPPELHILNRRSANCFETQLRCNRLCSVGHHVRQHVQSVTTASPSKGQSNAPRIDPDFKIQQESRTWSCSWPVASRSSSSSSCFSCVCVPRVNTVALGFCMFSWQIDHHLRYDALVTGDSGCLISNPRSQCSIETHREAEDSSNRHVLQ